MQPEVRSVAEQRSRLRTMEEEVERKQESKY